MDSTRRVLGQVPRYLNWIFSRPSPPPANDSERLLDKDLDRQLKEFGEQMPLEVRVHTFGIWLREQEPWDITSARSPPLWARDRDLRPVWWENARTILPCDDVPSLAEFARVLVPYADEFLALLAKRSGKPRALVVEVGIHSGGMLELSANSFRTFFLVFLRLQCQRHLLNIRVVFRGLGGTKRIAPPAIVEPLEKHLWDCCETLERFHKKEMTVEQLIESLGAPYDEERTRRLGEVYVAANGMGLWAAKQIIYDSNSLREQSIFIMSHLNGVD